MFLFPQNCISNAVLSEKKDNYKLRYVFNHKWLVTMLTNKDLLVISALFIVQSFPKWFVHFRMTFCKNPIRISCQIIFVNKHCPHSCPSPFKRRIANSGVNFLKTEERNIGEKGKIR